MHYPSSGHIKTEKVSDRIDIMGVKKKILAVVFVCLVLSLLVLSVPAVMKGDKK